MTVDLARLADELRAAGYTKTELRTTFDGHPYVEVNGLPARMVVRSDGTVSVNGVVAAGDAETVLPIIARALGAVPVAPPAPDAATRKLVKRVIRDTYGASHDATAHRGRWGDPSYVDEREAERLADAVLCALAGRLLPPGTVPVLVGDVEDAIDGIGMWADGLRDNSTHEDLADAELLEAARDRLRAALRGYDVLAT